MRLLRAAADEEAACIVVGHRPSVKALGSTAHGLVDHADRSVLVAPGTMSATDDMVVDGVPVALRDGSHVRIRQGRRSDRELLLRGFQRLSPESRYWRFLAAMPRLTEATVRQLTGIDHRDHEAVIALDEEGTEALGVALRARPRAAGCGRGRRHRGRRLAGRGLGTLLLEVISARAQEGVRTFTAWMLAQNREMMDLFQPRAGPGRRSRSRHGGDRGSATRRGARRAPGAASRRGGARRRGAGHASPLASVGRDAEIGRRSRSAPCRRRLSTLNCPPRAVTRSLIPTSPGPLGSAPPMPSSRTSSPASPRRSPRSRRRTPHGHA